MDARWTLVCHHSFLVDGFVDSRIQSLDAAQAQQVSHCIRFNLLIQWRIATQSWCQVDFEQPGLQVLIDQNVKAEHLNAVRTFGRAVHVCGVIDYRLAADHCLDDTVLDLLEQEHVVVPHKLQPLP